MKITEKQREQRRAAGKAGAGRPKTMTEAAIEQRRNAGKKNLSANPSRSTLWRWRNAK